MTYYRRRELGREEKIVSALVAAGAAAATAMVVGYVTRLFLARELLPRPSDFRLEGDAEAGSGRNPGTTKAGETSA